MRCRVCCQPPAAAAARRAGELSQLLPPGIIVMTAGGAARGRSTPRRGGGGGTSVFTVDTTAACPLTVTVPFSPSTPGSTTAGAGSSSQVRGWRVWEAAVWAAAAPTVIGAQATMPLNWASVLASAAMQAAAKTSRMGSRMFSRDVGWGMKRRNTEERRKLADSPTFELDRCWHQVYLGFLGFQHWPIGGLGSIDIDT